MSTVSEVILELINRNISISVAESCTGGLISSNITKYSGVSKIFSGGIICYSNKAKVKYLFVSKKTLSKYGAVSANVAEEMINGLYINEKTNFCISTTGVAGPNGGTKNKPVGLVFVGIKFKKRNYVYKKIFKGSRLDIQRKNKIYVFKKIKELI